MSSTLLQQFQGPLTSTLHSSRIHYWPAPSSTPAATLLYIPGNPGLADYYIAYLSALHRHVNSNGTSLEIFCPSQLGHDPFSSIMPPTLVSLDEQVVEKSRILETLSNRWTGNDRPRMILAGHSIGAWMALEIVRRGLNSSPVYSIHLLFPALHQMAQTPNAKRLAWLIRTGERKQRNLANLVLSTLFGLLVTLILKIVQVLPLPIVHFLVLLGAPTQPPSAVRTTTNFILSTVCVQQALFMGNLEMNLVRELKDLPATALDGPELQVRLRAYWASGDIDGWAPEKTRRVVENTLGLQAYSLPQDLLNKSTPMPPLQKTIRKQKGFSIDEIRKARLSKRRALAGMVRAGASASYGLATSLTQLGYRRTGDRPGDAPMPTRRRRPSLMAARATRRFDGSIYIEPSEEGSIEDLLASKAGHPINGLVLEHSHEEQADIRSQSTSEPDTKTLKMPSRASIVCTQGFKHAFVLEHSEEMASISAAMMLADITE